jgi:hypothetical protein
LHLGPPKRLRRIPAGFHLVPEPKVLEPLEHQQESRPLPIRETAEFRQILPLTPARLGYIHRRHPIRPENPGQLKKWSCEHFQVSEPL